METSVGSEGRALGQLTVGDLMTRDVVTLAEHEDLDLAGIIMRLGRIRHLPVVDAEGRLRGLVSHRDLLRAQIGAGDGPGAAQAQLARVAVSEVMQRDVTSVPGDRPLDEAARLMIEHKYGCLPVVDADGRLVGIVTETDFVRLTMRLVTGARGG